MTLLNKANLLKEGRSQSLVLSLRKTWNLRKKPILAARNNKSLRKIWNLRKKPILAAINNNKSLRKIWNLRKKPILAIDSNKSLRKIWNLRKKPILAAINNNVIVQYGLSWIKWNVTRPCYNNVTSFRKRFCHLFTRKKPQILMVGLSGSGNTTIFGQLIIKLEEVDYTTPSIGFLVRTIKYNNTSLSVWDVGGQDKIQPLWKHYFQNILGIIFVVDSSDRSRIVEARDELHRMMNEDELGRGAFLLVFANKNDLPNALSEDQITNLLRLHLLAPRCRFCRVKSTCATSHQGLLEGLNRLDYYIDFCISRGAQRYY